MPMQGYSVKKGDTIPKIASKFGLEESAIIDANGLKGGSDIRPGWRIIIPLPASSKTFERGVYTVKKGDTISAIAVLYDVSVKELMALNGLKKDSALTPGMKLKLPEGTYDGKALSNIGGTLDDDTTEDYTIKEGDSLFSVAKKYNTSVTKIAFLNGIKDPAKIKPGMKIQIPVKKEKGVSKSKKSQKTKKNGQTTPGPEETETKASEAESEESIFPPLNQEDLDIGKVEKGENEE
jgi:LysM repeat protein